MTKVAFICVNNSCRSQIAETLGKHLASDVFESYSAGTETKPQINQDAMRLMKQLYDIDMEQTQHSKLLADIPPVDVVITMGCNVTCPFLPCKHREDWGLDGRERIREMMEFLIVQPNEVTAYDEQLVRRLVEKVTVFDEKFVVVFKSGMEIEIIG